MADYSVDVSYMPVVNADINNIVDVDVSDLPAVEVSSLPDMKITEIGAMGPLTLAGIPNNYTVAISHLPDLNLRLKEIPNIRAHIPANFHLGFSIFGFELAALHLCGEAQIITEPYTPGPCERCGTPRGLLQPSSVGAVLRLKEQ